MVLGSDSPVAFHDSQGSECGRHVLPDLASHGVKNHKETYSAGKSVPFREMYTQRIAFPNIWRSNWLENSHSRQSSKCENALILIPNGKNQRQTTKILQHSPKVECTHEAWLRSWCSCHHRPWPPRKGKLSRWKNRKEMVLKKQQKSTSVQEKRCLKRFKRMRAILLRFLCEGWKCEGWKGTTTIWGLSWVQLYSSCDFTNTSKAGWCCRSSMVVKKCWHHKDTLCHLQYIVLYGNLAINNTVDGRNPAPPGMYDTM